MSVSAKFPTEVKSFTPKVDLVDTIYADHVNTLQEEVRAIELALGTATLVSDYGRTFQQSSEWSSLSDRLANIESGLVSGGLAGNFFKKTGDSILANSGTVGIAVKPAGGTSDLVQTRSAANSLGFRVDYLGIPYVGNNAVVYVGSSAYNALLNGQGVDVSGLLFNPFFLAGM